MVRVSAMRECIMRVWCGFVVSVYVLQYVAVPCGARLCGACMVRECVLRVRVVRVCVEPICGAGVFMRVCGAWVCGSFAW
jgi:hypothetical protein